MTGQARDEEEGLIDLMWIDNTRNAKIKWGQIEVPKILGLHLE